MPAAQFVFEMSQGYAYTGNASLVVNNSFSLNSPGPNIDCAVLLPDTDPPASDTLQFDHNLFNSMSGPIFDPTCRPQIMASGNTMGELLFENAAGGDFHLASGSPAIDSGNNSLLAELAMRGAPLTTDYDGNARPVDATGSRRPTRRQESRIPQS